MPVKAASLQGPEILMIFLRKIINMSFFQMPVKAASL
jgi:hypothetical protein